jgi:hypothetical protein
MYGGLATSQIFQGDYKVGYGNCWAVFISWLKAILPGGNLKALLQIQCTAGLSHIQKIRIP